jgi:CHAT domain-containing protein
MLTSNPNLNNMKKPKLLIILLFVPFLSYSQNDDWKTLNTLSNQSFSKGDYKKALFYAIEAKDAIEKEFGKESSNYANSCNNLGVMYNFNNDLKNAEIFLKESKSIQERIVGKNHADYATSCNTLAGLYNDKGNYLEAEKLYLEALAIREKLFGNEHLVYAKTCIDLAGVYLVNGKYSQAEQLYLKAKNIREKINGKNNTEYTYSCIVLANFYINIGNYTQAEPLINEAIEIDGKILDKDHTDYIGDYCNLANLYILTKRYYNAENILIELQKRIIKVSGKESLDYAFNCEQLAGIYLKYGKYNLAEQLYLEQKAIYDKLSGPNHLYLARNSHNIGLLYLAKGDNKNAEKSFLKSNSIIEEIFGNKHPSYASNCIGLANVYNNIKDYKKAYLYINQTYKNLDNQFLYNFGFMSENEKYLFLKENSDYFALFHSFAMRYKDSNPEYIGLNYDNELMHKGMILGSSLKMQKFLMNNSNPVLIEKYNRIVAIRKNLVLQNSVPKDKINVNIDSLELEANTLEKNLTMEVQSLPDFKDISNHKKNINWIDVRQALKPEEVAIEFISFKYRGDKRWTDSVYYTALLLKRDSKYPKMIYLCEERELQSLINIETGNIGQINNLYSIEGSYINSNQGYFLYQKIWQPLESGLEGVKRVFIAPSGLLHKVSFNAIAMPDKGFLSDKYQIETLSSTAELTNQDMSFKIATGIKTVIYGGIKYSISIDEMEKQATKYIQKDLPKLVANRIISQNSAVRGNTWSYLKGTLDEAISINNLSMLGGTIITGATANEESFKQLYGNNSPDIIHIATHGFTFPNPDDYYFEDELYESGAFQVSSNPLLRSGLLFAGANNTWNRDNLPDFMEDGILTAQEISQMYLPNTKLVVMSACETGLGDIKGSEGVFGLQRAFKMAGVDYIIMSLWQVPDEQTSELIQAFYKNWIDGKPIREAFTAAQHKLKDEYRDSPFMWAAFVLIN